MDIKILDCTLRDGGYYNSWDFSSEVFQSYLQAMADAKIDYVELGLRNFAKSGFHGPFAYTTESFLNRVELPVGPVYGVMIDAKTILDSELSVDETVDSLFVESHNSKINLVRIAAHFHEVERSKEIFQALKNKGYIVGLNLMQAAGKSEAELIEKAKLAQNFGGLEVLYFADSLGNMDSSEVVRVINALQLEWKGNIGIHTHDNMGKAIPNTIVAAEHGVSWLDSTVTGMGRGAGNAQTEILLATLNSSDTKYIAKPVYELAIRHFESMQRKEGWGSNLLYFLGAQNQVHPTYIQNLLSNSHFGTDEIVGAIDYLSDIDDTASYDGDVMKTALSFNSKTNVISGKDDLCGIFQDEDVLIVADGPNFKKYISDIIGYIEDSSPKVIAINTIDNLPNKYVDFYCISHNTKFLAEFGKYQKLNKPIILPKHRFTEDELATVQHTDLFDYGIDVKTSVLEASNTHAVIPYDLTTAYALAALTITGAKSISVVGFDGYEKGDQRQLEMVDVITLYQKSTDNVEIISLTPTSYPFKQGSLYAPKV